MSIFQSTVVTKHLKGQNSEIITAKWDIYKNHFLNPTIQENIRNSKEEQYQGGFIIDLFVNVLGYTKNPTPQFNITTEYKNIKNSKKADGAVIINNVVKAVIELKGTNTTDLGKVESQAFGYKNNQPQCTYIITSNFEKLRFYIDNAIEHIEFNLFTLTQEEFKLLYLCLAYENIEKDIPKKIKEESVSQEDAITKKLYNDYSLFKRELHQSLVALNPKFDALTLFKKSQKLLDRFLFLFFAEDRQLLPPNSVRLVLKQWKQLQDLDEDVPLYNRFKKYFDYLNTGFKGKQYNVYAYNGGLFKDDEILNAIIIDDNLLYKHTLKLSEYDFNSEVDVNILGHIFENSLNELEEIQAQLEGQDIDKTKSKRKKDGVFYTPKYITKYIVENTVGKLCEEKKTELKIIEEDYIADKKRQKKTRKELLNKLNNYRNWLLQLTICDPACGSGAFLNQALNFLIAEHKYIDELQAKLFGDAIILSDVEKSILENNLFGVDINEESVEIAKLSLWLRTAAPNRRLNDLSNNIKCGNSLIDDPEVAGEKAFNWQQEFPQIFKEKDRKAYHITTAIHDSRTSARMEKYKVRERRDLGTNPYPNVVFFTPEDDLLITKTIAEIVKEEQITLLAYNICADHLHLLLLCDISEIPDIMKKIKGKTAYILNKVKYSKGFKPDHKGFKPLVNIKNKPLWSQKYAAPKEITSAEQMQNTIKYIETNRTKHQLPQHSTQIHNIIDSMCSHYNDAFNNPEYVGGFDVVIGNPPYVFARDIISKELKDYYVNNYVSAEYQVNTYLLFIEQTIKIIKDTANYGLIIPNAWLMVGSATGLRNYILQNCSINEIINLAGYSFEGVNVETIIILATKTKQKLENNAIKVLLSDDEEFKYSHDRKQLDFEKNERFEFKVFSDEKSVALTKRLKTNSKNLDDLVLIKAGLQAYEKNKGEPKQTVEDVKNRPFDYTYKFDENTHKYLEGKDVGRYFTNWSGQYLQYGKNLASPRTFNLFDGEKIIIREITGKFPNSIISTYSEDLYLYNRSNIAIVKREELNISLKYVVAILNSQLMAYYFVKNTAKSVRKMFPKIILNDLRKFPIKNIPISEQQPFIEKADQMLSLNKELQLVSNTFVQLLQSKFSIEKLSKKLQNWYDLEFGEFLKELEKARKKEATAITRNSTSASASISTRDLSPLSPLSLQQEAEWMQYFNEQKNKAQAIKTKIDTTDMAIDQKVYELYSLTKEEVEIVEQGT